MSDNLQTKRGRRTLEGAAAPDRFLAAPEGFRVRRNPDILVVDDEPTVGTVAARYLEAAGFRVRCVGSGEEALRAMEDGASGVPVVITDIRMPGMSGVDRGDQHSIERGSEASRTLRASRARPETAPDLGEQLIGGEGLGQ